MDHLDNMGVSKLSAIFFFFSKVNYSFKCMKILYIGDSSSLATTRFQKLTFFPDLLLGYSLASGNKEYKLMHLRRV